MNQKKVPVTVLSGYLGSGKTTILNHVLNNRQGLKVAVIVNDLSEVNVDARLIKEGSSLSKTDETLVEMSNGCICCTLREDLLLEVQRLVNEKDFDYILIESTGIGEPLPVAQTFSYADEDNKVNLTEICHLDCMVTVVDAYRFWKDFASGETLLDRGQAVGEEDTREVVDLLIDQIEFCDVLILNKCDLVSENHLQELESVLRKLQPEAKFIRSTHGNINSSDILNTGLFNFEKASQSAGWLKELEKDSHTPETEEYGISSFVYRSNRPFHPERLAQWFDAWPEDVVRSKGVVWVANPNDTAISISQAGPSIQIGSAGSWIAALTEDEKESLLSSEPKLREIWDPMHGDRITELVFIGIQMDRSGIESSLAPCLLTVEEEKTDWSQFENTFQQWLEPDQVTLA